ncbi:MAG: hypothetical protein O7H41_08900 [Planctomycetota bacterium]|nr:hypothetical protein [Planctomycetota bacterium]
MRPVVSISRKSVSRRAHRLDGRVPGEEGKPAGLNPSEISKRHSAVPPGEGKRDLSDVSDPSACFALLEGGELPVAARTRRADPGRVGTVTGPGWSVPLEHFSGVFLRGPSRPEASAGPVEMA